MNTPPFVVEGWRDPRGIVDPDELARRIRPRTPGPDEMAVKYEANAYEAHDQLIKLGGRPSRPVRREPIGGTTLINGALYYTDSDTDVERCCDEDLYMSEYLSEESLKFEEELRRWQDFRKDQHEAHEASRIKGSVSHWPPTEYDEPVTKVWIRLRDWQEFQSWQQTVVDAVNFFTERSRQHWISFQQEGASRNVDHTDAHYLHYFQGLRYMFNEIEERQKKLREAEKQLAWIKEQHLSLVKEANVQLGASQTFQRQLESCIAENARDIYQRLKKSGWRPGRTLKPPSSPSNDWSSRQCHWEMERIHCHNEFLEWDKFLGWCSRDGGYHHAEDLPCRALCEAIIAYRIDETKIAKNWEDCQQQEVKWYEQAIERGWPDPVFSLQRNAERAREKATSAKEHLINAEAFLEKCKEQLAEVTLKGAIDSTDETGTAKVWYGSGSPEASLPTPFTEPSKKKDKEAERMHIMELNRILEQHHDSMMQTRLSSTSASTSQRPKSKSPESVHHHTSSANDKLLPPRYQVGSNRNFDAIQRPVPTGQVPESTSEQQFGESGPIPERVLPQVATAEAGAFLEQPPKAPKSVSGIRKADFGDESPLPKRSRGRPKKAERAAKTHNSKNAPEMKPAGALKPVAQSPRPRVDQAASIVDLLPHRSERSSDLNIGQRIRNTRSSSKKPPVNETPLRRSDRIKQLNRNKTPPSTTSSTELATAKNARITKRKEPGKKACPPRAK